MTNIGKILIVIGLIFGILGIRSLWRDYMYRRASVVVPAKVISAEIINVRSKHGNYYLRTTHRINQQLVFLRDDSMDTLPLVSDFLLYTEGKTSDNPNILPTVEEGMKTTKYVRYVPKVKTQETAFPERIDISDNPEYEPQYNLGLFSKMIFCFVFGAILNLFFRKRIGKTVI